MNEQGYATERDCYARHMRTNGRLEEVSRTLATNRELLIFLTGVDGRNGLVGTLRESDADQEQRIRQLEKTVTKGAAVAGLVAAVATTVLGLLTKFL